MRRNSIIFLTVILFISAVPCMAAAPRASDGHLFFLALLGFLGVILGLFYLADLIKYIISHSFGRNGSNYEV